MPRQNTGGDQWQLIYEGDSPDQSQTPSRRTRRNQKRAIGCRQKDIEYYIGDCVLVESRTDEPDVAVLKDIGLDHNGEMQASLVWFTLPSTVRRNKRDDSLDGEIYCTADVNMNDIELICGRATVVSRKDFSTRTSESMFVCRRAYDSSRGVYSEEFDWATVYHGRKTDMDAYVENVLDLLPATNKKKRGRPPRGSTKSQTKPKNEMMDVKNAYDSGEDESEEDFVVRQRDELTESSDEDFDSESDAPSRKRRATAKLERTPRKKKNPQKTEKLPTPSKKRDRPKSAPVTPQKSAPMTTTERIISMTPMSRRIFMKKSPTKNPVTLPTRADIDIQSAIETSPHKTARQNLHVASLPDSLPCRENEFSQLFLALESAINSRTGTCLYVSGTPGTGKTATIREVVAQLQLRRDDGELSDFNFVEINGMKLTNPHTAYEMLWEAISGDRVSAASATILLEQAFKTKSDTRMPTVVLMDELDQLVTRNQVVMYNFFNWPTLVHSRLIVIAVANTMDLPERTLSNKISSRLGLMRIQFPGYSYQQLVEIISSRLAQATDVFDHDAIEFAARKIAGVSGDARRALEICRRAVELAEPDGNTVTLRHIKEAISESTSSPLAKFLQTLAMAGKVLLCAILARVRRSGVIENPLADILTETERLVNLTEKAPQTQALLWPNGRVRMAGFLNALSELGEGGVIVQQAMRGESTASVRLIVPEDIVKTALKDDQDVADIL